MNLPNGTVLQGGRYKITRFIAGGGFGCTYEGVHTLMNKRIAIKEFFVKDFCERDETTKRIITTKSKEALVNRLCEKFIEEAKALFSLHHAGIVQVYDVFMENDTAFYVMEYIDGQSLSDMVNANGPMSEAEAVKYIMKAAEALEYVHKHKRLHLDIKPANIMVTQEGEVKLIDFGVSKQYDEVDGHNTSTLLGMTPGFAAPEQQANDVSLFMPATDVYALGATLYYLLTGITPISAAKRACGEAMAPLPAGVSEATVQTIELALNPNRNHRQQSMGEFISGLKPDEETSAPADSTSTPEEVAEETPEEAATRVIEPDEKTKATTPAAPVPPSPPTPSLPPVDETIAVGGIALPPENNSDEDDEDDKPKKSNKGYIVAISVIMAIVIAIVCIVGFSRGSDDSDYYAQDTTTARVKEMTDSSVYYIDGDIAISPSKCEEGLFDNNALLAVVYGDEHMARYPFLLLGAISTNCTFNFNEDGLLTSIESHGEKRELIEYYYDDNNNLRCTHTHNINYPIGSNPEEVMIYQIEGNSATATDSALNMVYIYEKDDSCEIMRIKDSSDFHTTLYRAPNGLVTELRIIFERELESVYYDIYFCYDENQRLSQINTEVKEGETKTMESIAKFTYGDFDEHGNLLNYTINATRSSDGQTQEIRIESKRNYIYY